MKKRLVYLALMLVVFTGLFLVFTMPVAAATAPTKMWVEPSDMNNIPAQIDVFKARTGGSSYNPTYTYQIYLPGNVDAESCFLSWDGGATATVGGNTYPSGSCPVPTPDTGTETTYTFKNGNTTLTSFKVITYKGSPNVTPVFIEIDESQGSIADMKRSKDNTCSGIIYIDGEQCVLSKMKGRGNATWQEAQDKKPYNITLGSKINFPGIDSEKTKKWSFLAEVLDRSLLCNRSGYHLAYELGIGQDTTSADVWMNGEYQGCYTVTPKTDSFVTKNGYMIEQDNYIEPSVADGGDPQFSLEGLESHVISPNWTSSYNFITVKDIGDNLLGKDEQGQVNDSPENKEAVALNTLKPWLQDAWDAIRSDDGYNSKGKYYTEYIDIESFAKMYLMHEYVKSYDVCAGSILFHRDGDTDADKLIAGPLWDLDNAMGSTYNNQYLGNVSVRTSAEGDFIQNISNYRNYGEEYKTSIYKTISKHEDFMAEVSRQYNKYKWAFDALESDTAQMISNIDASAKMNHIKVIDIGNGEGKNNHYYSSNTTLGSAPYSQTYVKTSTWANYAANLKTYIRVRSLWFANNYYDPNYVDPATCDHQYEETVTPATCTADGSITYTCPICGDSYTETIPKIAHDYQDGVCIVCGETLLNVTISCDSGASVTVFETQDINGSYIENAEIVHPRDGDSGLIDCSGEGQINFAVNLKPGYELESVTPEPDSAYKNLKIIDTYTYVYRLTKVSGDLTITVKTAGDSYAVTLNDYTKGAATIDGLEDGEAYSGDTVFSVTSEKVCVAGYYAEGEDYQKLVPEKDGQVYSYTLPVDQEVTVEIAYLGDVNKDGAVRNDDVLILARYMANWDGYASRVYMPASDIDGDGDVDNRDLLILARYLAGVSSTNEYFINTALTND